MYFNQWKTSKSSAHNFTTWRLMIGENKIIDLCEFMILLFTSPLVEEFDTVDLLMKDINWKATPNTSLMPWMKL